uniref:Uncharacterized protein n=1 Tax=Sciurus vulgaris TaxID=55149 RepID=A0A8D2E089_SCIVU
MIGKYFFPFCCLSKSLDCTFESFGYWPRSGIAGSNGGSIPFLRNLHTAFQCGSTNLQPHQQCMSVPFSPHPRQHLLLLVFFTIAILIGVRGNLEVVLICISLITGNVEHFFIYLLIACRSSCLFISLAHLLIGLFVF